MVSREHCLEEAKKIICQDRNNQYGTPEDNFSKIAKLWSAYLDVDVDSKDVGIMMALFKVARIKTGSFKEDSYIDLVGYGACACECASKE